MREVNRLCVFNTTVPPDLISDFELGDNRAIWYDGASELITSLNRYIKPKEIVIEENISKKVCRALGLDPASVKVYGSPEKLMSMDEKKFCIYPASDTHVRSILNITKRLNKDLYEVRVLRNKNESAEKALEENRIEFKYFSPQLKEISSYSGLILLTDWGYSEIHILQRFQKLGLPVIGIQESIVDFGDKLRRMEWCNFPFIQGLATINYLDRSILFLTGNPRYEDLKVLPPPDKDKVLINVNFTYGIHEQVREAWLKDVITCCESCGYDYWITQHPRDPADLSQYPLAPSGPAKIHEAIKNSSIVITRFSSLIHESIALGRAVIYYNPHQERMGYDFEPQGDYLLVVDNQQDLKKSLGRLIDYPDHQFLEPITDYVNRHLGSADGMVTDRILKALNVVGGMPGKIEIRNDLIKKTHFYFHFLREC